MSDEQKLTEDRTSATFENAPGDTMIGRTMEQQGRGCGCLEMLGLERGSGCCAEIMPKTKAACRRFALVAGLALIALIGGVSLLVWGLFHVAAA